MKRFHPLRYLAILGLLPAFATVFWLTALLASHVPGLLILGVNVHGLSLASYEAESAPRPAPVSLRVLQDAQQDASPSTTRSNPIPGVAQPAPSPTASPTPTGLPLPTPTPAPVPTPSPGPIPVPTPSLSPAPSLSPVPLPLPVPTVSSLPPGF